MEDTDVMMDGDQELTPFIRVGTTYYKIASQPQPDGSRSVKRLRWEKNTISFDFGKEYLRQIPRYNGFCTVPVHIGYRRDINGFYNIYEPISHEPSMGPWRNIQMLVEHIFGEQYEYGLDYLQLLYLRPTQKLPILLLVSEERNTGKTTFLNFLKSVFEDNATFNTNEDFRSKFNSDWAGKLLVMVDEALLTRREDSERLKNLSTAKTYKAEAKGKDRDEINFFAKFVMCSNNERTPVLIDPGETRYWVRKIEPLRNDDTEFLKHLRTEIPAFLGYLNRRTLYTRQLSRMWFKPEHLETSALRRIIRSNRNRLELELVEQLRDIMLSTGNESVSFCLNDILTLLTYSNVKAERSQIRTILQEYWKIYPVNNALTYQRWELNVMQPGGYSSTSHTGRFYTVTKSFLDTLGL